MGFSQKTIKKILFRLIVNPTIAFIIYFSLIAIFGFFRKQVGILLLIIFPWILLLLIIIYLPFILFLFHVSEISISKKINHVLEHGTIYFLKKQYGKKYRIGGRSLDGGFRIYGDIESKKDITEAFEKLKSYLTDGESKAVLSKYCGSSTHILEGLSFIMLTITLLVFLFFKLSLSTITLILLINVILYFLFRYPIGKYFQKKFVMYFNFYEPRIVSIEKVDKTGLWERSPVYFVKTAYRI